MFWGLTLRQFTLIAERHKEHERRKDQRAGDVLAMLYNINRDAKKDPDGKTWLDFYPEHKPPKKPQTEEQMLEAMKMWAAATSRKARA